ncbi:hypothetical protein [Nonomuraea sp. NPDC052265]|uniref:hypothetical protein n=1 Tax=Nonomuraea sp. NPDC052265 TaxID=3364374 RepID=UPI0037C9FA40
MAERSYPFDAGDGAILTESDWEAMASLWQDDGVAAAPGSTDLSVVSQLVPGELKISPGRATFRGYHYVLDAETTIGYTLNDHASQWRGDSIVLRLDRGTNKVALAVKEGVPGGSAPNPDKTGPTPELWVASYNVPPNSAPVPVGQVIDRRTYVSRGIRISAKGDETFPDGTIYYDANVGRFYAKIKEKNASSSVTAPLPKFREVIVTVAGDSSGYPEPTVGALVWDQALNQLLIQTSWDTPTWTPVGGGGGSSTFSAMERRGADLTLTSGSTTTDPLLTIAVDRGIYQFDGVVFYRATTAASTVSVRLDHPSLGTNGKVTAVFEYVTTSSGTTASRSNSIAGNPSQSVGAQTASTVYSCRVTGTFANPAGSAGNVSLSYVGPSNASLSILAGSYLSVRKI